VRTAAGAPSEGWIANRETLERVTAWLYVNCFKIEGMAPESCMRRSSTGVVLKSNTMRLAVALFLPFVIACGRTPTAPETAVLRFTPRAVAPGSGESASVKADAGHGQIAVRATLLGPDPCRTLEGELEQRDREVTLRVFIRPSGAGVCVQVIGGFAYDAVIERLPRGSHVLQVVHTYPSTGWSTRIVLNETVDVR